MSIARVFVRDAGSQRRLAREHPIACFVREWWSDASALALLLLLVERADFFGGRMDVRIAATLVLVAGAISAGARVTGLYWTERRRVARGDT